MYFRVGIAYVLTGWLLLQAADFALDLIGSPNWVIQSLTVIIIIGLPIALLFAWAFEMTPEGIKREADVDRSDSATVKTGNTLNYAITGVLVLIIALMATERFLLTDSGTPDPVVAADEQAVTIAVLPFVNMSSDPEQEYFSDGITEEILNHLARIPDLQVTARTSAFSFKGQNRDLREVAEILGVDTLLEGSVRRDGEQVRITAQLIRAEDGFHLWSDSYDRTLESIFAVQDEISAEIASALQITLGISDDATEARRVDPVAYDMYLKARGLHRARGEGLLEAIALFEQSLAIDPDFAPAWAGLSQSLAVVSAYVGGEALERLGDLDARRSEAANNALRLDPETPLTFHAVANNLLAENRWAESQEAFLEALRLDPDSTDVMEDYAHFLLYSWQPEEALKVTNRMLSLDPLVPIFLFAGIRVNKALGNQEAADRYLRQALDINPDLANMQYEELERLLRDGDLAAAHEYVDQMNLLGLTTPGTMHRLLEWAADASQALDPELENALENFPIIARIFGSSDLWLQMAQKTIDGSRSWENRIGTMVNVLSIIDPEQRQEVLASPQLHGMLEQIGLAEYWREVGWPKECRPIDETRFTCGQEALETTGS